MRIAALLLLLSLALPSALGDSLRHERGRCLMRGEAMGGLPRLFNDWAPAVVRLFVAFVCLSPCFVCLSIQGPISRNLAAY